MAVKTHKSKKMAVPHKSHILNLGMKLFYFFKFYNFYLGFTSVELEH